MKKEPQNLKTAIESLRNATQEFHRHIEVLPLLEAQDRILAETICAKISLPRFDNSAMDGYALKVANAGKKLKIQSKILREIARKWIWETWNVPRL